MESSTEDLSKDSHTIEEPWRTFTLTHVDYPAGDAIGKILAIISLLPLVIVIIFITFFVAKRDLHTLVYGIGVILNGILNYVLKHTIKEPRPNSGSHSKTLGAHSKGVIRDSTKLFEEYGMPSSHSQFMWFVSVYMLLFVMFRLHHQKSCFQTLWKSLLCCTCLGLAGLVSFGRIYLHYHTWSQVIWGMAIGSSSALIWFLIVNFLFTPCFPWIASTRIAELFMIRDYTHIPNVIWFDYTNARGEANKRFRKMSRAKQQ